MRIRYSAAETGRPVKKAFVYTKSEHGIDKNDVEGEAIRIVERLKASGHETYIVGGAVRDLLVGKKPKDFDIVTDATPSKIKRVFRNSRIIGRRFRLVHVFFGPKIFEVSTFRSLKDGPTSNTYGNIEEDVQRRDFTMNALFYEPQEQVVVDYVGGFKDIKVRRIKPIIPLKVIFVDDPVRMIRAAKYAAITGFKLPLLLRWKIRSQADLLASVSPSRLTEEIFKIIHSGRSAAIAEKLTELSLYSYLQPSAAALMREDGDFRVRYMADLADLDRVVADGREPASGRLLSFLLKGYLDRTVDWNGEPAENYRSALASCRNYVLPMNPPRVELENGVRLLFRERGVAVKKARTYEKGRNKELVPDDDGMEKTTPTVDGDQTVKKRRRRRRRRSSGGATVPSPIGD